MASNVSPAVSSGPSTATTTGIVNPYRPRTALIPTTNETAPPAAPNPYKRRVDIAATDPPQPPPNTQKRRPKQRLGKRSRSEAEKEAEGGQKAQQEKSSQPPTRAPRLAWADATANLHQKLFNSAANTYNDRIRFYEQLRSILKTTIRGCELIPTGSVVAGVFLADSDMDFVFIPPHHSPLDCDEAHLSTVRTILSRALKTHVQFIPARVPIVKGARRDHFVPFDFDISCGSTMGVEGCYYIRAVLDLVPEGRPLALLFKHWATRLGIIDSQRHRFCSHAILLMVIHFLQHEGRIPKLDPRQVALPPAWGMPRPLVCSEPETDLFALLLRCLGFYATLLNGPAHPRYGTMCISVRQSGASHFNPGTSNSPLVVQDPIDIDLNVTRNLNSPAYHLMISCAQAAKTDLPRQLGLALGRGPLSSH